MIKKFNENKETKSNSPNKASQKALKIIRNEVKYETLLRAKESVTKPNLKPSASKKREDPQPTNKDPHEVENLGPLGTSIITLVILGFILKVIHSNTDYLIGKVPIAEGLLLKYKYFISNNTAKILDSKLIEKLTHFLN